MRHTRCLYSPARALHRVFLSDLASSSGYHNGLLRAQPALRAAAASSSIGIVTKPRQLSPLVLQLQSQRYASSRKKNKYKKPPPKKQHLKNEEIPSEWVQIVTPEGGLAPPERLHHALRAINLDTHALIMVSKPPRGSSEDAEEDEDDMLSWTRGPAPAQQQQQPVVCKVVDLKVQMAEEAEAAREARARALSTKELEINWAIAPYDLVHKLRKLRSFLNKGMRVVVTLARKRGSRPATPEKAASVLEEVRAAALEMDKVVEARQPEGEVNRVLQLVFQGPTKKKEDKGKKGKQEEEEEEEEEDEDEEEGEEGGEEEGADREKVEEQRF
ncbi:hypothetical protein F4810DRAFT_115553 [Camillea tinctor]|nr:hypothetical protein F4810DRAFT_115553 [Camillea tinctor]